MTVVTTTGAVNYGKSTETPQWESGIYQIEVSDPVLADLTEFLTARLNNWPAERHTQTEGRKKRNRPGCTYRGS